MRVALAALVGVIPWIPAAPPPTPHPPLAPACQPGQLTVVAADAQGATGSLSGGVVLRNAGSPCSLIGRPQVTFDPPAPTAPGTTGVPEVGPVMPPRFSLRAIPTGAEVGFPFWWSNWCSGPPNALVVALPQGGVVRVAFHVAPRCDSPTSPSTIWAGTFQQTEPQPRPSTHLPFAVGFVRSQSSVRAGSVLHYEVALRNTSRTAFRFGKCPAYVESLVETTIISELHVLNCRPAGTIAPGATRVFAMQMRVPRRAAGKRWALFFDLGPETFEPDEQPPGTNPLVAVS
jgi:hypothetical protein